MDSNHSQTAHRYLEATPRAKWGAIACSALASVCLALLFPLLYLFADLIVYQGHIPTYAASPPARQKAFREEWDARLATAPDVAAVVDKTGTTSIFGSPPDEVQLWEGRWQAATYAHLAGRVGPAAAEAYMPGVADAPVWMAHQTTDRTLGLLSPVARERGRWTGAVLAWLAGWNPWAWTPGEDGTANASYLTGLLALALVLVVARGVFANAAAYLATGASVEAGVRVRRAIFTHAFRLNAMAVRPEAQEEAGELVTRRVEQVQDGLFTYLTDAARGPVLTGLLLVVLLAAHFWLSISLLLIAAVVWLVAGQAAAFFRRDARLAARRAEARLGMMRESLGLVHLVKAYLMERFSQTRFERHVSDLARSARRRLRGEAFSRPTLVLAASLAGAAMLYLAARVVLGGDMTPAGLVVKGAALGTLVFAVNRWIAARARVTRGWEAAAGLTEFLDRRGEAGQPIDAEFLPPMNKKLELVDISVREPGTGRMVLENVSLTVPAGSRAAVVFTDQSEAEALAHLVTRFIEPTAGEVRIDGKNVRWVTSESVRAQAGLVLERGLTFTDTVANNIGCGDPSFSLPQIIEAAKLAHAHQFVQKLPYGYETQIGAGGSSLRPGERYRIALARAILRDPSLMIIEEPADPLDPDSWVLIDDTIARVQAGRTVMLLARRPSTVRAADRVFVLQNGRLAASGSHAELLAENELYRLLHFKQNLTAVGSG